MTTVRTTEIQTVANKVTMTETDKYSLYIVSYE